jgi:hypothetical protein
MHDRAAEPRPPLRVRLLEAGRLLRLGVGAGAVTGFLVAGVGSRLAMLLLRFTSDPALAGTVTDDGFVIGAITADTFFLLAAGTLIGIAFGPLYLGVREWLPRRGRRWLFAAWVGVLGGGAIINPGGVDFTVVGPRWLALLLFVGVPFTLGLALATLIEWRLGSRQPSRLVALLPLMMIPTGLLVLPALLAAVAGIALDSGGQIDRWWRAPAARWAGRALLLAGLVIGAAELVGDVSTVL